MSDKKIKKESQDKCTSYPIALFMFSMYVFAFVLAIVSGGILIDASMAPFVVNDAYDVIEENDQVGKTRQTQMDSDREDLKYLYLSSLVIGSLSIFSSLVFLWQAVDLGIILFCGRTKSKNAYEHYVKKQMRQIVGDKTLLHRKKWKNSCDLVFLKIKRL